ncbi:MAG TPA: hypothetical protein VGM92_01290 [Candidatus Kapabacteria bacterium]|jgi:DNA replication protein DnaC
MITPFKEIKPSPHWEVVTEDVFPGSELAVREPASIGALVSGVFADAICIKCGEQFRYAKSRHNFTMALCLNCTPTDAEPQRKTREEQWQGKCPFEVYRDSRFVPHAPRKIYEAFKTSFLKLTANKTAPGIYATGPKGTFKTTMMWHVMRQLHSRGWSVQCWTANGLADALLDAFSSESHGAFVRNLITCDALYIDDLDKGGVDGRATAPPSLIKGVYEAINGRYNNGKPLFITTNARADAIDSIYTEQFGPVIRRRIAETCTLIETGKLMPEATARRYNDE